MCEPLTLKQAEEFDLLTFKAINNSPLQITDQQRYNNLLSIKQEHTVPLDKFNAASKNFHRNRN